MRKGSGGRRIDVGEDEKKKNASEISHVRLHLGGSREVLALAAPDRATVHTTTTVFAGVRVVPKV